MTTAERVIADDRTAGWEPVSGRTRGTVVLVPGRGENAAVYERFGRRLAADGYRAVAAGDTTGGAPDLGARVREIADGAERPLVVVGSDVGALHALVAAAARPDLVDGVIAVGTPLHAGIRPAGWEDELSSRSACPVHRDRMEAELDRGALAATQPDAHLLAAARSARPAAPVLFLHGTDDTIAGIGAVRDHARSMRGARLVAVAGGRHDALNDVSHRSVAAEVVQFLERLRLPAGAGPVLTIEVA